MVEVAAPTGDKHFRVLASSGDVLFGPFVGPMKVKELRCHVLETHPSQRMLKFSPFADCRRELLDNHWLPPHHDVYMIYGDLVEPTEELWKREDALYWLREGFATVDAELKDMAHPELQRELDNIAGTNTEFRVLGLSGEILFGPFNGPIQVKALKQLLQEAAPIERVRTILACSQRGLVMLDYHWIPSLHDVYSIQGDFAMPSSEEWQDKDELQAVIKLAIASLQQQMMIVDAVVAALSADRQSVSADGRHKAAEDCFQTRMNEPVFNVAFRRKDIEDIGGEYISGESEVQGYADAGIKMKFWLNILPTWVVFVFKSTSPDASL